MKTNFYDKKATYCFLAVIAIIDVAFVFHLCFSYDAIIRPILPRLIAEDKIGNRKYHKRRKLAGVFYDIV